MYRFFLCVLSFTFLSFTVFGFFPFLAVMLSYVKKKIKRSA